MNNTQSNGRLSPYVTVEDLPGEPAELHQLAGSLRDLAAQVDAIAAAIVMRQHLAAVPGGVLRAFNRPPSRTTAVP